jgi:signal transduction histidine kinase
MMPNPLNSLILNVDDTDAARYAKSRILTHAGFSVIEAASGGEALKRAKAEKPDLVLLDVKLPDINGFEVCRRLKEDPSTQMVLVLQTSASYIASSDKIRALDGGADNYLFEPIEPEELVANVRALLRLGHVEKELREVDRRKNEFLAILAHELRNPLGPIRNAVELLRQLAPSVPAAQENARQVIVRQTDHMTRLVDDLLDVSRITQGKITLRQEPVELKAFIHTAFETAAPMIETRRHKFIVNLPQQEIWIKGDSVRLAQIVGNLLHNAAKFTSPSGELEVRAEQAGGSVIIQVRDNGIGISSESVPVIFDLFSQAEHAPDRVQDGLGIGLSLVKTLVELHGGSVKAMSPGIGQGSTFELQLPVMQLGLELTTTSTATTSSQVNRRRIHVVDDNVDSVDIICSLLELNGHDVQKSYDGATAIESARCSPPDIIILDIGLPDMTGFELAVQLRKLPGMDNVILIALTGYGQEEDKKRALDAGFNHHLTKPVTLNTLVRTIQELSH